MSIDASVLVAVIGGLVTALGWLVSTRLTASQERQRQQADALLKYVERQLEELYGPLAFLIYEGRRTYEDLLEALGRTYVFEANAPLPEDELRIWLFWTEFDFLPRNAKIKALLTSKTHLIDGPTFLDSYIAFLDHTNSWEISHRRWKEQKVEYPWHSKVNWPDEFESEVTDTFQDLKAKHAALIGKLESAPDRKPFDRSLWGIDVKS